MRISTTQIYTQGVKSFGDQQVKLAELQQQISTGVRISKPSDDPAASARVLELQQTIDVNEQYQVNIDHAESRLTLEDTTLNSIENIMIRIKELTIQANNATNDFVSRSAIANEVDERYKELLSLSNTIDSNGDYLFAGFQSKSPPFTEATTGSISYVQFNGDQGERSIQISQSRQINVDTSGADLFMRVPSTSALNQSTDITNTGSGQIAYAQVFDNFVYIPGDYQIQFTTATDYDVVDVNGVIGPPTGTNTPGQIVSTGVYSDSQNIEFLGIRTSITGTPDVGDNFSISAGQYEDVFSIVQNLSLALRASGSNEKLSANMDQAIQDIDTSFNRVLEARTSVGGRLNSLDAQREDNEAFIIVTRETMGVLRDVDLAEAISQLTLEQTTLDAAQAVFSRITSSSLFNFLR